MAENLDRRSTGHKLEKLPNYGINLLLDERFPPSLNKGDNERSEEVVFFDQYKRMSNSTITRDSPSNSFDNLYFLGVRLVEVSKMRKKVIMYHHNSRITTCDLKIFNLGSTLFEKELN